MKLKMVVFTPNLLIAICLDSRQYNVLTTNMDCGGKYKGIKIISLRSHNLSSCELQCRCLDGGSSSTQMFTTDGTDNEGTSSSI